jgi:hypothetical protein
MFGWLKKLLPGARATEVPANAPSEQAEERTVRRVRDVLDEFLTQNPQPTPHMVHALVSAGAADLPDSEAVLQLCELIQTHGYQYPLNPTLQKELKQSEILPYLQWQVATGADREEYRDQSTIRHLIERFRTDGNSE